MTRNRWFDSARNQLNDALSGGTHWTRTGATLRGHYDRSGELSVLDEAIAAYRRAVAATPPGHPDLGCRLGWLGSALRERFEKVGERWCLDAAVRIYQKAANATPDGHAHRQEHLSQLVAVLRRQLEVNGGTGKRDDIATAMRQLADACPDNGDRAHRLYELGELHWERFRQQGELSSLTAAVNAYRIATEPPLHRHAHQKVHLIHRATALVALIERAAQPQLLDEMVSVRRQLLDCTPHTLPEYRDRRVDLSVALWARYRQDARPELLEELVAVFKQVAAETPEDHPHPGCQLSNVANMLTEKLGDSADPALLAEIVDLHRQAVKAISVDHPHRLRHLSLLGTALHRCYQRSGDVTVLDEMIDVWRLLVAATSPDNADRPNYLDFFSRLLLDRYQRTGDGRMLEEIIAVHQDLTAALGSDDPERPRHLSNLGFVLRERFQRSKDPALLDPIIDVFRRAMMVMPAVNPQRPKILSNLGAALVEQASRAGLSDRRARWQEAAAMMRSAADALPLEDPDWPLVRCNLGAVLQQKFEQLNDPADLREAVEVFRNAVQMTPIDSPHGLRCLTRLAEASLACAELPGSPIELVNEAIATQRQLLEATPTDMPERANHEARLAGALQFRHHRFGDLDALEQAVRIHRDLAARILPGHPGRRCALHNLGNALRVRDVAADHPAGVAQETLEILREAAGFPADGPAQPNQTDLDDPGHQAQNEPDLLTTLPITIYLSDEAAHEQVEAAVEDLLAATDNHIDHRGDPVLGSWFRHLRARTGHDATVTATMLQNLGPVLVALQPTKDAVIRAGALLIVKTDWNLVVVQLTPAQQLLLNDQPQLAKSPHGILSALESQSDSSALHTRDTAADQDAHPAQADFDIPGHYAQHLSDFVAALEIRARHTVELPTVDEMITVLRLLTGGLDVYAHDLLRLGGALLFRHGYPGGTELLDEAIKVLRLALQATPAEHSNRPACLGLLGEALHRSYHRCRDVKQLDEAINMLRESSAGTSIDDPTCRDRLIMFSRALRHRYNLGGNRALLAQAVTAHQQAASLPSNGTLERSRLLDELADVLLRLARHTDELAKFHDAVRTYRQAVDATPDEYQEDRAHHLCGLGSALVALSKRAGDPSFLDQAIPILREARTAAPPDHPNQVVCLINLGSALHAKYQVTRLQALLDEAIDIGRLAVRLSDEPAGLALASASLSHRLLSSSQVNTDAAALDDAVHYAKQALEMLPADHVDRGARLSELGNALFASYQRSGEPDQLEEAIRHYEQARQITPADHAHRTGVYNSLGAALLWHYDRTGELGVLDEAIDLLQQAVDALPAEHPDRPERLTHLGLVLHRRYDRTGNQDDLNEAVQWQRAAAATSQHHQDRHIYLNNLGNVLASLAHLTGKPELLEESIGAHQEACTACPTGHSMQPCLRANLSAALLAQYRQTKEPAVIDEAVHMQRRAVTGTPTNHPHRPVHLAELSTVLLDRHELTCEQRDLVEAAEVLRQAAAAATVATPRGQIDVHARWGRLAARTGDWGAALDALATAVGLLARIVPPGLHRDDQEHQLAGFAGLASDAAACALQVGDSWRAVELLEHGRGVLLTQAMTRGEETEFRERDPALADRLDWLRAKFARGADVAVEWEQLMEGIRAMPGFERFLLPPTKDNLRTDLPDGPVVLINVSQLRSDALILRAGNVSVVPLPALDLGKVRVHTNRFLTAIKLVNGSGAESQRAQQNIRGTLCWLWDAVAAPVLDALALTVPADRKPLPKLWWSPTGLLSLLPLHAAGHHYDQPHGPSGPLPRTVIDRVISSYTPTVQMLRRACRRQQELLVRTPRVLMVSMQNTPGADRLTETWKEAFASAGQPDVRIMSDQGATRQQVIDDLPAYTWVHFACHSNTDLVRPSASYLFLHDHAERKLTAQDISGLRLRDVQLAFLSACDTARTSDDLADEAIHLASSFQIAGYPHVVATLWSVQDRYAHQVAAEFYEKLGDGPRVDRNCFATTVHKAIKELRSRDLWNDPWVWGAYIHMGP